MSNFKDTKNKIETIWNNIYSNSDVISNQESINTKIDERTNKFNTLQTQLKSIKNQTSEFVQPILIPYQGISNRYAGYTWTISISNISEILLNAFYFDFLVKSGDGDIYTDFVPSNLSIKKRVTYQRLQSLSDPNSLDLKVDASIFFESSTSVQSDLYVKLIIIETNPYLFTNG